MELSAVSMECLMPVLRLQLENGGRAPLVVTGVSMLPTLRNCRDMVELVPLTRGLRKGDLILYQRVNGAYVLHRIVKKPHDGQLVCSGDNQWQPEPVKAEQVIALVDTYIRDGKRISVEKPSCRLWVGFWVFLFPVRKPFLKLRRAIGQWRRKHGGCK